MFGTTWKRLWTVLGFVGLVVMTANIEKVATLFGLDSALVAVIENSPSWLSGAWQALTSPIAFTLAIVAVAYSAGLFTEAFFRRLGKPMDRQHLAGWCRNSAKIIRANAEWAGNEEGHALYIRLQSQMLEHRFKKDFGLRVRLQPRDIESSLATANFLENAAKMIEQGDIAELREIITAVKDANRGPQLLPDTATETPPKTPHG